MKISGLKSPGGASFGTGGIAADEGFASTAAEAPAEEELAPTAEEAPRAGKAEN